MTHFDRILLVAAVIFAISASENAKEAHRHAHELACHVGAADLCRYHGAAP